MAQIFISHSQRDEEIVALFLKAFAGTKVKPIFQEFEKELPQGVSADEITRNIETSNAVFVLLSERVQSLQHTRDWIVWECGRAKNKPIWIFEPYESLHRISIVIPRFDHYVRFAVTDDWRKYLRSVIESYDDSHVIPALSAGAGIGAVLNENDRGEGALKGLMVSVAGLILHSVTKPTFGYRVKCAKCPSNFSVHIPDGAYEFRCPNCNSYLMFTTTLQTSANAFRAAQ